MSEKLVAAAYNAGLVDGADAERKRIFQMIEQELEQCICEKPVQHIIKALSQGTHEPKWVCMFT